MLVDRIQQIIESEDIHSLIGLAEQNGFSVIAEYKNKPELIEYVWHEQSQWRSTDDDRV